MVKTMANFCNTINKKKIENAFVNSIVEFARNNLVCELYLSFLELTKLSFKYFHYLIIKVTLEILDNTVIVRNSSDY